MINLTDNKWMQILVCGISGLLIGPGFLFFLYPIRNIHPVIIFLFILTGCCLSYCMLSGSFHRTLRFLNRKQRIFFQFLLVFLSIIITLGLRGHQTHLLNNGPLITVIVYLSAVSFIFLLLTALLWSILRYSQKELPHLLPKWYILIYTLLPFGLSMIYFWAFFPGILVIDSVNQWQQAHSLFFNDWHPVMMTWIISLLTKVWDNPAAFVILQFSATSLITGYVIYTFRCLGTNRWVTLSGWLFLTFFPMTALYSVIIWKDTLFSYLILLLTTLLIQIIRSRGGWLKSPVHLLFLYITLSGMVFFRHNGWPVLLATLVIFPVFFRKKFLRMYAVFVAVAVTYLVVTGPVFSHYKVYPADKTESLSIPLQQIGRIVSENGNINEAQKAYFNQIFPLERWSNTYQPSQSDPVKFSRGFNKAIIRNNPGAFINNWFAVVRQNPALSIQATLDMEQLVFKLHIPQDQMKPILRYKAFDSFRPVFFLPQKVIEKKHVDYKPFNYAQYGSNRANTHLAWIIENYGKIYTNKIIRPFMMPAFYMYLILIFLFIIIIKGNWKLTLAILPAALNLGSVAAAIPAQDPRYLFSNYLLVVPFFFLATLIAGRGEKDV
ncbi:DUF6020 family protein [Sporolactobacillus sp. Y61]|uniref:DUF6020 family protein n=1 Tax=Sporolactobacillus sp. Y61 TaxID=3160863 RepID=A0AAU8IC09_9BACL